MAEKKIWKKEEIKDLLQKSDKAVMRGLVVIYSLQTEDEKKAEETSEHNGVGFSGVDAKFLSSLAKQVMVKGRLSEKQMLHARKKMMKYAGQLTLVSNGKLVVNV
jgi:hypothetical protein